MLNTCHPTEDVLLSESSEAGTVRTKRTIANYRLSTFHGGAGTVVMIANIFESSRLYRAESVIPTDLVSRWEHDRRVFQNIFSTC